MALNFGLLSVITTVAVILDIGLSPRGFVARSAPPRGNHSDDQLPSTLYVITGARCCHSGSVSDRALCCSLRQWRCWTGPSTPNRRDFTSALEAAYGSGNEAYVIS